MLELQQPVQDHGDDHGDRSGESARTAHRPRVEGKFLFCGTSKLYLKGVTYGPFCPDTRSGCEYHDPQDRQRRFLR